MQTTTAPAGSSFPPEPRSADMPRCSDCGSNDVRRSHSHGVFDGFARMLGLRAYRCRGCRARFLARSR